MESGAVTSSNRSKMAVTGAGSLRGKTEGKGVIWGILYIWNVIFFELDAQRGSFLLVSTAMINFEQMTCKGQDLAYVHQHAHLKPTLAHTYARTCMHKHTCALPPLILPTHTLNFAHLKWLASFFFSSVLASTGSLIPDVCTQSNYTMWYSGLLSEPDAGISPNGVLLSAVPPRRSLRV